jgi:hypothetical protein
MGSQTIALFIVAIAVVGALASWRASVWAGRAADLEQRASQERILEGQIGTTISGEVAHHRRLWQDVRARLAEAEELQRQAELTRATDRVRSRALHELAQVELAAADSMRLELGALSYSASEERRWLEADNPDLQTLRPKELENSAVAAHDRKLRLVIIYICFVGAIVALTFAILNRGPVRRALTAAAAVISIGAFIAFVIPVVPP